MFGLFSKKSPEEKLEKKIQSAFSKPLAKVLSDNIKPTFVFDPKEQKDPPVGTSKEAGFPDLPPGFQWPEYDGKPLEFVVQLNLSSFDAASIGLPGTGMLYYFMACDLPSGEAPNQPDQYHVFYSPETSGLQRTPYEKKNNVSESALEAIPSVSIPDEMSPLILDADPSDKEVDALIDLSLESIPKWFGDGMYEAGSLFEEGVQTQWSKAVKEQSSDGDAGSGTQDDFVQTLTFIMDEWGIPDCWMHFGITPHDLSNKDFGKSVVAFRYS